MQCKYCDIPMERISDSLFECKSCAHIEDQLIKQDFTATYSNKGLVEGMEPRFIKPEPRFINPEKDFLGYGKKQSDNTKHENSSANNGGETDYYKLKSAPFPITDFDDFAEWRKLNGFQFNIGKIVWTFNEGRHTGTDYERDLNKIVHYAQRELRRLKRQT